MQTTVNLIFISCCSCTTITEMDCFVEAFRYLTKHIPWSSIEYPYPLLQCDKDVIEAEMKHWIGVYSGLDGHTNWNFHLTEAFEYKEECVRPHLLGASSANTSTDNITAGAKQEFKFPCLMVLAGSAFAYLRVSFFFQWTQENLWSSRRPLQDSRRGLEAVIRRTSILSVPTGL